MWQEFNDAITWLRSERHNDKVKEVIYNADISHASVALKSLFAVSIEDHLPVKIVSGHLDRGFYNPLADDISKVMDSGCQVELIVLRPNEETKKGNNFYRAINESRLGKVLFSDGLDAPHFALVGDRCHRLETDHGKAKAVISFNNEFVGRFLDEKFEELENNILKTRETNISPDTASQSAY